MKLKKRQVLGQQLLGGSGISHQPNIQQGGIVLSTSDGIEGINKKVSKKTLDGFMILERCKAEFPDEVLHASLSGLQIQNAVADDLTFFCNLARLNMSDNEAPIEPFGSLPALIELDFQCNAVEKICISSGFAALEVLNLSFNCLRMSDVESLSHLPRIRELYLGHNYIQQLPPVMDQFAKLETLSLESNGISGNEIFKFLSLAPKLRNLNLSHNKLTVFQEAAVAVNGVSGAGFYNLMYLNIAYNLVSNEKNIMAISILHSMRKLVMYGNPLAHAAVCSHDQSKLVYDPVPNLTMLTRESEAREFPVDIVAAYPETKKSRHGAYENVEIFKIIPDKTLLPPSYVVAKSPRKQNEIIKVQTARASEVIACNVDHKFASPSSDATFLTSVGVENNYHDPVIKSPQKYTEARSMFTTGKDMDKFNLLNSRAAANALRYQLNHPLTSHNDIDILPQSSQKSTESNDQRQRPRVRYVSKSHSQRNHAASGDRGIKPPRSSYVQAVENNISQLGSQVNERDDFNIKCALQALDSGSNKK